MNKILPRVLLLLAIRPAGAADGLEGDAAREILEAARRRRRREARPATVDAQPVFDGMAAAYGCLYLSLKDGTVVCMGKLR